MLIASVPQLHKKWRQVALELGRDRHCGTPAAARITRCTRSPGPTGAGGEARPALAEVEEDHFVGCIRPYVEGAC